MLLEGHVAVITGAGSERRVGRAVARRFTAAGPRSLFLTSSAPFSADAFGIVG
jgi:NAD(P)-dependent dehydrogenase (short-subunit alcohol dehydrogenase family)